MKFFFNILGTGLALLLPLIGSAATLSISPSSGSFNIGDTFNVNINLDTAGANIDGADISYLNYNPALLQVQGTTITAGTLMPVTIANTVDAVNGRIRFSQENAGGTIFNGAGVLAQVQFKVLGAGTASASFDFTSGNTTQTTVASAGTNLLTGVTNGSYTLISPSPSISPPPTITFAANPTAVVSGQGATLIWSSTNATSCTASNGWSGAMPTNGSETVYPTTATTYTLTCTGTGGTVSANVAINILPTPTNPNSSAGSPTLSNIGQFNTDGSAIAEGGTVLSNTVVFKGRVTDPNNLARLEVELHNVNEYFTGAANLTTSYEIPGPIFSIIKSGLPNGTYKWRMRASDSNSASVWQDFGTGSQHDFVVVSSSVPGNTNNNQEAIQFTPSPKPVPGQKIHLDLQANLELGANSSDVARLQEYLEFLGYMPTTQTITGYFGQATVRAVILYQADHGVIQTGVVGPLTRSFLSKGDVVGGMTPSTGGGKGITLSRNLYYGLRGNDVLRLQNYLKNAGYLRASVTGFFGNLTLAAVKSYQRSHSIRATGFVGALTRASLAGR